MKIQIDHNHLLTITNPNIPQTKEYTYNVGGYAFSDYDKGIIILHKKNFKIINLKNLGDGMNVIYSKEPSTEKIELDQDAIKQAFGLFSSFDETTGKTYFFIPNMNEKDIQQKNQMLEKLHINSRLTKTEKGITIEGLPFNGTDNKLSFLFGILLLYGKLDTKKGELISMKIHLPLFGQYMKYAEVIDSIISGLRDQGIFLKADKLTNSNGITYQISSNDYELLEIFAKWYEPIEKFEQITKATFTQEMKARLIEFLESNPEIPSEGKAEVMKQIKSGTIKFLMK